MNNTRASSRPGGAHGTARTPSGVARRVVIAGTGIAGLEALLALRALAGARVSIDVIAPGEAFLAGPMSVAEAFEIGEPRELELGSLLREQDAHRHVDALVEVDAVRQTVRTGVGNIVPYDELIVALGAQSVGALPGALSFRGRRDVPAVRELLADLENGQVSRVVFVLPSGNAWPLPLYELALIAAARVGGRPDGAVSIVTAEQAPLELFGARAAAAIAALLRARRVDVHLGASASAIVWSPEPASWSASSSVSSSGSTWPSRECWARRARDTSRAAGGSSARSGAR